MSIKTYIGKRFVITTSLLKKINNRIELAYENNFGVFMKIINNGKLHSVAGVSENSISSGKEV